MSARNAYELFIAYERLGHTLRTIAARCADGMPARFALPTGRCIAIDPPAGRTASDLCEVLHTDAPLVVPVSLRCPLDAAIDSSLARRFGPTRSAWPRSAYDAAADPPAAILRIALAVTLGIKYCRVRLAGVTSDTGLVLANSAAARSVLIEIMQDAGALTLLFWRDGMATVVSHANPVDPWLPSLKGDAFASPTDRGVAELLSCMVG